MPCRHFNFLSPIRSTCRSCMWRRLQRDGRTVARRSNHEEAKNKKGKREWKKGEKEFPLGFAGNSPIQTTPEWKLWGRCRRRCCGCARCGSVNKDGWTCHYCSTTIIFQKRCKQHKVQPKTEPHLTLCYYSCTVSLLKDLPLHTHIQESALSVDFNPTAAFRDNVDFTQIYWAPIMIIELYVG